MPWCDACSAYHAPTALSDGACPVCGGPVDQDKEAADVNVGANAPWHFWVVVALLALYLLWRVVDLVVWLVR